MSEPLTVLSLGAGVQSTALALLSFAGDIPPVDHVIFADTGWEPAEVYEHLDRLDQRVFKPAGIPLHRVIQGNIRDDALNPGHRYASMPVFLQSAPTPDNPTGRGMGRRQCTNEYKLTPIKAKVRELLGADVTIDDAGRRRVGRTPRGRYVVNYVGISMDEIGRVTTSDVQYMKRVDPLIDLLDPPWSRQACITYLEDQWPWSVPRSACIGCPYHSNAEWRKMRDESPDEFADAVDFDYSIRTRHGDRSKWSGKLFLHEQRVPLDQVDLGADDITPRQTTLFDEPFGCSPFGCQRDTLEPCG